MSEGFQIVGLTTVTDEMLTSNVPESEPAWNSAANYVSGDERAHVHYVWKATGSSTNKEPGTAEGAAFWTQIKPTNRWAMFDDVIDTQTSNPDSIEVEIAVSGRFDTLVLFGLEAATANVTVMNGAAVLFEEDYDLVDYSGIVGYWSLYFEEHGRRETLPVTGLPILSGLTLKVSALLAGGNAKIGSLDFGRSETIGATLINPTLGFLSFSKIAADELGARKIVKRASRKQGDFDVAVPNLKFDTIYRKITSYDGVPALIIASDEYEAMIYKGLITGAKLTLPFYEYPILRVSIEDF